jgi:hypothetical protein
MTFPQIPWPVNCAVIVGTPVAATIAEHLQYINPILQASAYLFAIAWAALQMYLAWSGRRKR